MSDPREESWAASPEDEESPIEAAENPDAKSPEPETAEPAAPEQEAEAAAPAEDAAQEPAAPEQEAEAAAPVEDAAPQQSVQPESEAQSPAGFRGGSDPESGAYRYVRQSAEPVYADAHYEPAGESTVPPQYYTPPQKTERPHKSKKSSGNSKILAAIALCLVCAILGGLLGAGIMSARLNDRISGLEQSISANSAQSAEALNTAQAAQASADKGGLSAQTIAEGGTMTAAQIYAQACAQVVGITTSVSYTNYFGQSGTSEISGSGFFISEDGYILTNYHVIETAQDKDLPITVVTYDGTSYQATIVGTEAANDLAVLKIDASGLNAAAFADSDALQVGDTVYPVGNPMGELEFSMSTGHVSALNRTITTEDAEDIRMFQIDAAVNPGNSGGPVYDANGKVVGVVTAKYSDSGVEGLGFAIPASDAASITEDLITKGYVSGKAYMGVMLDERYNSIYAEYYNMPLGAYVYSVESGTAADRAGLEAGDIITALGERKIESYTDLRSALKDYSAGDTAEMTVYRAGESMTITITFDEVVPDKTS